MLLQRWIFQDVVNPLPPKKKQLLLYAKSSCGVEKDE